jgi:hypothetical protein
MPNGKRHREKVGHKADAIKLYQLRKGDAIAGRKMPELRDTKVLRFSEFISEVEAASGISPQVARNGTITHHSTPAVYTPRGRLSAQPVSPQPGLLHRDEAPRNAPHGTERS